MSGVANLLHTLKGSTKSLFFSESPGTTKVFRNPNPTAKGGGTGGLMFKCSRHPGHGLGSDLPLHR